MRMRKRRKWTIVLGVVLVGLVGAAVAIAATNRSGVVTKFDGRDEIVNVCTTTSTFQTIPGMTRTWTQAGPGTTSVAVMFSGSLSLSGTTFDTGFLRLTIDGAQQTPGVVPAIGEGDQGAHAFNWQTAPLGAGSHTARIQWRTDLGSSLCADARSVIVLHR
jgi:hypothetical protein